ncbi:hypothetical protein [Alteromonas sp. a30]|uniref:hypothetical protein n=1 Tax=Alteromonas sp. a30 TaxID=2730917 RepID=UPI00227DA451|nr:hypothetical protein [Alteromonas sp. a30]MCY7296227.1 hypothetical protein [Alteromonas sp. a30]
MSNCYFLVCMDCKSGILLGKTVEAKYSDITKSTSGFSELGTNKDHWHFNYKCAVNLQHFLMLHRGHELRVLPDTVDKLARDKGFPNTWVGENNDPDPDYDRLSFLNQDVGIPDPESEMENLPNELLERLSKF